MSSSSRSPLRIAPQDLRKALNAFIVVGLRGVSRWQRLTGSFRIEKGAPYRKVFVVGCPRSGTTWIHSILSCHPRVVSGPESHAYDTLLGPFVHRHLRGDRAWRVALTRYEILAAEDMNAGLHLYTTRRDLYRLIAAARAHDDWSADQAAEQVIEWIFDRFFARRGGTSEHLLAEKTPRHQVYAARILKRYPAARMIEVIRDGRDVCVSMEKLATSQWWPPSDRAAQARTWLDYVTRGLSLRSNPEFSARVLPVHFESVKENPAREIRRLFDFIELPCTTTEAEGIASATDFERIPKTGPGRPFRSGRAGDWRTHFSQKDLDVFRRVVGDRFSDAGYSY